MHGLVRACMLHGGHRHATYTNAQQRCMLSDKSAFSFVVRSHLRIPVLFCFFSRLVIPVVFETCVPLLIPISFRVSHCLITSRME